MIEKNHSELSSEEEINGQIGSISYIDNVYLKIIFLIDFYLIYLPLLFDCGGILVSLRFLYNEQK